MLSNRTVLCRASEADPRLNLLQAPHQQLHVIDFEYASANPRAYDIGEF